MSELIKGYFYDEGGVLFHWYVGASPEDQIDSKEGAVGFIASEFVDSNYNKYDFNENKIVATVPTGSVS